MTQQPANSAPSPLQRWWPVALVAAVALVTYATSLRNEFIYDDWNFLVHNSAIRSWANWWELVDPTSTYNRTFELLSWRPTLNLSYLVGYQLFGLNAGGHHLLTVVLHALNAALVYHFLRRLTSNATVALVGGLAFAVHPVHAEAIQVSSLRMDVLATPFFLAALLAHMRLRERPDDRPFVWAGLAAGSCFLSLMGKEIGAAVPLVALLLDLRKEDLKALTSRAGMLPYLGYASVGVIYGWLRFGLFSNIHQGAGYLGGSPLVALTTTGKIFAAYAGHLLWPLTLRADYVVTLATGLDVATVAAWALLAALAAVAYLARRRAPTLTFGLVWLAFTLLPVANLVPIRNPMADRYLYLPSVGFFAIAGWAAAEGARAAKARWGTAGGRAVFALVASVLIAWGALTVRQSAIWHDDITLWRETLRLEPDSARAHHNLGSALGRVGRNREAESQLEATIRRWPRWAEPYYSLGTIYAKQGKDERAAALFRETLRWRPSHRRARSQLATIEAASAGTSEAIERARAGILAEPTLPQGHYHLGVLYQRQGMRKQAKAAYREAVRLEPGFAKALNNLGIILASEGNLGEAEKAFGRAVAADPGYARAHLNLANLYLQRQSPRQALPHLEAVIRLEPNHPRAEQIRALVRRIRQGS